MSAKTCNSLLFSSLYLSVSSVLPTNPNPNSPSDLTIQRFYDFTTRACPCGRSHL